MKTLITIFSGGGGVEVGAMAAGIQPIGAVEFDPAVAGVYRANIGDHVTIGRVEEILPARFDRPDILHAASSCAP